MEINMSILTALKKKSRPTSYTDLGIQFSVIKDGSGMHELVDKITGEKLNPAKSLDKFMLVMPQITESKCQNYGSDD